MFSWQSQDRREETPKEQADSTTSHPNHDSQSREGFDTSPEDSKTARDPEEGPPKDTRISGDPPTRDELKPFDSDTKDHLSSITPNPVLNSRSLPHRVDSLPVPTHRRDQPYAYTNHQPSPPPIATLSHSPSLSASSLDRSAVSTPNPLQRPPQESFSPHQMYSPYPPSHYQQPTRIPYPNEYPSRPQSYPYSHVPQFDHRYDQNQAMHSQTHHLASAFPPPQLHLPSLPSTSSGGMRNHAFGPSPYTVPGQNNPSPIYTDNAATKLNDRVRRRCFNCCTTDTSTWRRSNLSPGKVLCNKCGLFERTHSRPRPEQFPHKRGPLASTSLRPSMPSSPYLPPIANHGQTLPAYHTYSSAAESLEQRKDYASNTLPEIQSWVNEPASGRGEKPKSAKRTEDTPPARPQSPRSPRAQQPPAETNDTSSGEKRDSET